MNGPDEAKKLVQQALCANNALVDAMEALWELTHDANNLLTAMCHDFGCKTIAELKSKKPEAHVFVSNLETLVLGSADAAFKISEMIGDEGLWRVEQ